MARAMTAAGAAAALTMAWWSAASARAEEGAVPPISLGDARAAAVARAPELALARAREAIARAQIDAAGALANPTLTVVTARQTATLGTAVSVPLPLFGQRTTAVSAARADAEAVRLDTEAVRREALWSGTMAWLDLWEAQERARLLAGAAADAGRVAAIAEERFKAGSAARVDVLRTSADSARARADASAGASAIPAAAARLAIWIGADERGALRALGEPSLPGVLADLLTLERTIPGHPAVERDRAQVAAAAAHVGAEKRLRWPSVAAELAVNQNDPTLPGTDVIAGVSFEVPVLSLRSGAIARARAEQALAETGAEVEARRLRAALVDAYRRAEGAGEQARALATDVLPALEEVRRMTEEGYRDGRIDLLRVLEAERALVESRLAQVQARAAWQRALADVERSVGASWNGAGR